MLFCIMNQFRLHLYVFWTVFLVSYLIFYFLLEFKYLTRNPYWKKKTTVIKGLLKSLKNDKIGNWKKKH